MHVFFFTKSKKTHTQIHLSTAFFKVFVHSHASGKPPGYAQIHTVWSDCYHCNRTPVRSWQTDKQVLFMVRCHLLKTGQESSDFNLDSLASGVAVWNSWRPAYLSSAPNYQSEGSNQSPGATQAQCVEAYQGVLKNIQKSILPVQKRQKNLQELDPWTTLQRLQSAGTGTANTDIISD